MSNGETTLKNEDSINCLFVHFVFFLSFSFRRLILLARAFFIFLVSSYLSLSLFHTRILSLSRRIFFFEFSFSHTHAHFLPLSRVYTIDAKCPYTVRRMCVCVRFSDRSIFFLPPSRSVFARRFLYDITFAFSAFILFEIRYFPL